MESEELSNRTTAELVRRASQQVSNLVRDEISLARAEMTEKGKRAGIGAAMFGAAGIFALYGLAALMVGAGLAIALVLPGWAAALIIGGGIFLIVGICVVLGRVNARKSVPPMPEKAIQSVREDINVVAAAARDGAHR
jgi:uncharacterized membrane protein YqjE